MFLFLCPVPPRCDYSRYGFLASTSHQCRRHDLFWGHVACLTGGIEVKERLLLGLVLPKLSWPGPLAPSGNRSLGPFTGPCGELVCGAAEVESCLGGHACIPHPRLYAAVQCLRRIAGVLVIGCPVLRESVYHHAAHLQFQVVGEEVQGVLLTRCSSNAHAASSRCCSGVRCSGWPGQPFCSKR